MTGRDDQTKLSTIQRLASVDDDAASTDGSVTLIATDDEGLFSTGETWDAS